MFHGEHINKGYDSADFFCENFPVIASDKVKRVIKRVMGIPFSHNPFITFLTLSLTSIVLC